MSDPWTNIVETFSKPKQKKVSMSTKALLSYIHAKQGKTFLVGEEIPPAVLINAYNDIINEGNGSYKSMLVHQLELSMTDLLQAHVNLECFQLKQRLKNQMHFIKENNSINHLITGSQVTINVIGDNNTVSSAAMLYHQFKTNRNFLTKVVT